VVAAFLPREQTQKIIADEIREGGAQALDAFAQLESRIVEIKSTRISVVHGLYIPGIDGIAVPIFAPRRSIAAVIASLGPTTAFDSSLSGPVAKALLNTSFQISMHLGAVEEELSEAGPARPAARSGEKWPSGVR
jgi:DNA-binding IclR family transcriptional regulator